MPQSNPQQNDDDDLRARVDIEAPGFKFGFDPEDGWRAIGMALVLVLGTVAGVKLIWDYL
jgi:hypothetical protein